MMFMQWIPDGKAEDWKDQLCAPEEIWESKGICLGYTVLRNFRVTWYRKTEFECDSRKVDECKEPIGSGWNGCLRVVPRDIWRPWKSELIPCPCHVVLDYGERGKILLLGF